MQTIDVWATAKRLVAEHGEMAQLFADAQALEEFLCGEKEASADWERVSDAVRRLLDRERSADSRTPTDPQEEPLGLMQFPSAAGPAGALPY